MTALRWKAGTGAWTSIAALPACLCAAGIIGWLAVEQPKAGVAVAVAVLAVPVVLASGLTIRGIVITGALAGHLVSGPLYVQGLVSGSLAVLLDLLVLVAFGLLAFERQSASRAWRLATLALAAFVVLQAFNPILPSISYGLTGARSIAIPLLLLVAVGSGELNARDKRVLMAVGVIGWTINVLVAGRQLLFGFSPAELLWIQSSHATYLVGEQIRLIGATRSNQDFAFLVAIAFPAVCACAFARGKSRAWSFGFRVLAIATLAVLIGSLVRSGLVAGVIGALGVGAVLARDNATRRRVIVPGLVLVVTIWVVAIAGLGLVLPEKQAQTVRSRVTSVFNPGGDFAFQQRQSVVWPHAIEEIEAHPLGAGAGSAGPLSQVREDAPLGSLVPDNGYLLMAVQFGLLGLLLFLFTLVLILIELWRRARAGILVAAAAFGAVLALCVAMLTGNFVSLVAPSCVWAVLVGLGLRTDQTSAIDKRAVKQA